LAVTEPEIGALRADVAKILPVDVSSADIPGVPDFLQYSVDGFRNYVNQQL